MSALPTSCEFSFALAQIQEGPPRDGCPALTPWSHVRDMHPVLRYRSGRPRSTISIARLIGPSPHGQGLVLCNATPPTGEPDPMDRNKIALAMRVRLSG